MKSLYLDGEKIKGLTLTGKSHSGTKKVQQKIVDIFSDWFWLVTDYGWAVVVHCVDDFSDMPTGADGNTAMRTTAIYCYLRADIYVNLEVCTLQPNDFLLEAVVHELTHLLVTPMENSDQQRMEYTVTTISRALLKAKKN